MMDRPLPTREVVKATTTDGWPLSVYHYRPVEGTVAPHPVILCHGLAANRNSCDFGEFGTPDWERYSLAAYLTRPRQPGGATFDVWVPELRGGGTPAFDPSRHPERYRWSVDDYIDFDAPAIVRRVQEHYQKAEGRTPTVFWVGKSMGGMIAYAYGETAAGRRHLAGVVTIGSPVLFGKSTIFLEFLTRVTPRNISIPIRIADLVGSVQEIAERFKDLGVNADNIDPAVLDRYLRVGMGGVLSSKVLSQFSLFFRHGTFCRYPSRPWIVDLARFVPWVRTRLRPYSYTDHLPLFSTPLLVIAGGSDRMAPREEMHYVVDHVSSRDVTYKEFSKERGYAISYGHLDLTIGRNVRDDVYPVIASWLAQRNLGP